MPIYLLSKYKIINISKNINIFYDSTKFFIVTLVNKCYALIYQLPDKVLRWIGVSGEQTDISSVKETQQSFDQGAKQGIAPLEGVATGAAGKLKEHVQAATKKDGSGLGHGGPGG